MVDHDWKHDRQGHQQQRKGIQEHSQRDIEKQKKAHDYLGGNRKRGDPGRDHLGNLGQGEKKAVQSGTDDDDKDHA